jgi:hypothetical protein
MALPSAGSTEGNRKITAPFDEGAGGTVHFAVRLTTWEDAVHQLASHQPLARGTGGRAAVLMRLWSREVASGRATIPEYGQSGILSTTTPFSVTSPSADTLAPSGTW